MDSLTHIVLGATVGELVAGKKLGKKSWLAGAFLQTIPDFDFIAGLWCSPAEDLLAHRGFTHSFFFIALLAPLFSWGIIRTRWGSQASLACWLSLTVIELLTHILLDGFNVYGTAWFEPFTHVRISFDTLFVADPFFTIPVLVGIVWIIFFSRTHEKRLKTVLLVLSFCFFYLSYAFNNRLIVESEVKRSLAQSDFKWNRILITPTPFNSWLWYIVIERQHDFLSGYRSVFDTTTSIQYTSTLKQHQWLEGLAPREDIAHLVRFSNGYYAIQKWQDTLVLNDLRFGKMMGWEHPNNRYVFYYYVEQPDNNQFLIQRGRVQGWSLYSIRKFAQRIFHAN
jgi:inner membrane protein